MTFLGVIFTVVYISRICHFLFFVLFDLMTLNMCHMLCSTLGQFSPSYKSVNLSVPD